MAEEPALVPLRQMFNKDFKKQLYTDQDDLEFFNRIKSELKQVERRLDDGAVVLQHLEMFLINVACDDPGATIGSVLVLPLLQGRLDRKAMEFATHKAALAEQEILKMEKENDEKRTAEAAKKQKLKRKLKEKVRQAKEKKAAEQKAKEELEKAEHEAALCREKERLQKEFHHKEEKIARLKREEEELIKKRRRELLSEENGYWRLRMEASALAQGNEAAGPSRSQNIVDDREDNFKSVSNPRRRQQERRQQERRQQPSTFHQRWNSASNACLQGSRNLYRRHKSADLDTANQRCSQPSRATNHIELQGQRPNHHSVRQPNNVRTSQQKPGTADSPAHPSGCPVPPNRSQSLPAASSNSGVVTPKKGCESLGPYPRAQMPVGAKPQVQQICAAERAINGPQVVKEAEVVTELGSVGKSAWIRGEIPPEVLGISRKQNKVGRPQSTAKEEIGSSGSRSGSEADRTESVSFPDTPDATEVDAPSIRSDSDSPQPALSENIGSCSKRDLPHIKTAVPSKAEILELKDIDLSPSSRLTSPKLHSLKGSRDQFFRMVRSASGGGDTDLPDAKGGLDDASEGECGQVKDTEEEVLQEGHPDQEHNPEQHTPRTQTMLTPMGPPPFGIPMGGPIGGFHPGVFPHMRAVGPPLRPVIPIMMRPAFMRPPVTMHPARSVSPPVSPHPGSLQMSKVVAPSSPSHGHSSPVQQGMAPVYYFHPVMPPGGSMIPQYMSMMPHGQWMGYPVGPSHGPGFHCNERQMKKFTLRPNAKEFIPRSMMEETNDQVEAPEATMASTGGSDSDRDADVAEDERHEEMTVEKKIGRQLTSETDVDSDREEQTIEVGVKDLRCKNQKVAPEGPDVGNSSMQPVEQTV